MPPTARNLKSLPTPHLRGVAPFDVERGLPAPITCGRLSAFGPGSMMIFPKSVTRPITEPVIVSCDDRHRRSGAAPFLTTSEPSPAAWVRGERGRRHGERRAGSENEGEAPHCSQSIALLSFPAIQGSVKVLLRATTLPPDAPRRPARARPRARRRGSGGREPAAPQLLGLRVTNGSTPFLGDGPLLTTVSPNGDGFRDAAHVQFRLAGPARVAPDGRSRPTRRRPTPRRAPRTSSSGCRRARFAAGAHELVWTPRRDTAPRTYVLQLTVSAAAAAACTASAHRARARTRRSCACRESRRASSKPSYAPGESAAVTVATDAKTLTFQVFAYGGGAFPSVRDLRTSGQAMTAAARVDWRAHRDAPASIQFVRAGRLAERPLLPAHLRRRRARRLRAAHRPAATARRASASRSCSRRRRGRPTTSPTRTATAGATRGTSAGATAPST